MSRKLAWMCLVLAVAALWMALIPIGTALAQVPPIIEAVAPAEAEQGQTLELHIFGANFVEGVNISLATPERTEEGIIVESVEFVSETELVAYIVIAPDASAEWDVIVTNPDAQSYTLSGAFTVSPVASDITPPEPITGLTATDAHDGKIDLGWNPSTADDFYAYRIYASESEITDVSEMEPAGKITDIGMTNYQVSGLENGVTYYFAVTAVNVNGDEDTAVTDVSAIPTPSVVADITPPEPITGLAATDAHDGKIDLGWNPSTADDFYAYRIYASESEITNVSGMEPLGVITDIERTSAQVVGFENGVTYYFAVTAVDASGNEDTAVTDVSATPTPSVVADITPPEPITGLTATDAHDGKIDLSWSPSTADDFYAYRIYVGESEITNVSGMEPLGVITDMGKAGYQVAELEHGVTYYFAVTAVDVNGNEDTSVSSIGAIPTPSYIPAPVLKVSNIIPFPAEPNAGEIFSISASITNIGDADAADIRIIFIVDGDPVGDKIVTVPVGSSVEVSYGWATLLEGAYTFGVEVMNFEGEAMTAPAEITVNIFPYTLGFPTLEESGFVIPGTVVAFFLVAMYWVVYLPRKRAQEVTGEAAELRFSGVDITQKPQ